MKRKKTRKKRSRLESILLLVIIAVVSWVCGFFIGYLHTGFGTDGGGVAREMKLPLDLEKLKEMAYEVWYDKDETREDEERHALHTRILQQIIAHYPDEFDAHLYLGTHYVKYVDPPDWDHAEWHCRKALELRETAREAAMAKQSLGVVMNGKGRHDEAEALYQESIEMDPGCQQAYSNYARLLRNAGRFSESVSVCSELLKMNPDHEKAKKQIEYCEKELRKLDPYSAKETDSPRLQPSLCRASAFALCATA